MDGAGVRMSDGAGMTGVAELQEVLLATDTLARVNGFGVPRESAVGKSAAGHEVTVVGHGFRRDLVRLPAGLPRLPFPAR